MPAHRKKSLELAFAIFDHDENEMIDKREIIKLFDAINSQFESTHTYRSKLVVEKLFNKFDSDHSDYLDKNEFIEALSNEKVFDIFMEKNE